MQALEQVILPRSRDIGGFEVSRILPVKSKRMVGPFVFLDQMGPTEFCPAKALTYCHTLILGWRRSPIYIKGR